MQIIAHRGAAGLALENTLDSFELAVLVGVDAIELDVRQTKDGHLVVCHDGDLQRVANKSKRLSKLSLKQLQKITLLDKHSIVPTLHNVLELLGETPIIIELKETGLAKKLLSLLDKFPSSNVSVASFKLDELAKLRKLRPELPLYGLERTRPTEIIRLARSLYLSGIGLNFWLLNPLTYWLVRRHKLDLYVFTVNSPFVARFLSWLYPNVAICTDHPERFVSPPMPREKRYNTSRKNE